MSNESLLQLWYLPVEITYLQNEIARTTRRRIPEDEKPYVAELLDILHRRLQRCQTEQDAALAFIKGISDPWLKVAFELRYVQRIRWADVGAQMGLSKDCCKRMTERYLERSEAAEPPQP